MRLAELDQEGIAEAVFGCTAAYLGHGYQWDDVDNHRVGAFMLIARWIMEYGLDCRRDQEEKCREDVKRAFEKGW